MNQPLRVLLVGRHFWPHGSHDSAGYLCRLARGLQRQNVQVEVCSPRHNAAWPEQITWDQITVHRPGVVPRRDWSVGRYIKHLTHWLRQHGEGFDVLFADSMREEAVAVVDAAQTLGCASVVRDFGYGVNGDLAWSKLSRNCRRHWQSASAANYLVTSSSSKHRKLIAHGCSTAKIIRINPGFEPSVLVSPEQRQAARQALAEVNLDLKTDPETPVILCIGRMTASGGMNRLVANAYWLLSRYQEAKLWLIGDGGYREVIHQELRSNGLRDSIAMPGSFVSFSDLFAAADVYVQGDEEGLENALPTAICADLPIVTVDTEATRTVLSQPGYRAPQVNQSFISPDDQDMSEAQGIQWFDQEVPKSMRQALRNVMDNLPTCRLQAAAFHKQLAREHPYRQTIDSYLDLFRSV